jgi:4-carboxymuconolactone decarboxylase
VSGTVTPIGLAFWAILLIGRMSQAIADADLKIDVVSLGARTSNPGAPANFTGAVQVEQLFAAQSGRGVSGGKVTFEPGARSFWHTHPKGQTLIVTAGVGLIQQWGGAVRSIKTGDVVWIPPGIKHWHGAAPNTTMAHFAIQEALDGKVVDWMEPVSDAQYLSGAAKARSQSNCYFGDSMLTQSDVGQVSPALAAFTQEKLFGEVWKRGNLSLRDRSMVTLAALIARNQTMQLHYYLNLALDSGVKPGEISEIIFHLAFYSGWENAIAATVSAKEVFDKRGIHADSLPPASVPSLPLNEAAEKQRATTVEQNFGAVAPGVVQYTTDLLFRDLWLRPALAPRDRSLVTVSALIASGQVAQVTYHLNRAMDNGLTQTQAAEVLTHLAFYAGWPNVFSALPVAKEVFAKRAF